MGTGVSVLLHVAVIVLLLMPLAITGDVLEFAQGAGGPGPAGGGGGGTRGTGAIKREMLRFVRLEPPPPAPVLQPKVAPPAPVIVPPPQQAEPKIETPKLPDAALTTGVNGGTGADATSGTGPGTGGGVGTGIGTGRGSATGPGTGGGDQPNYPPTPIEMFIPPLPVPQSVKGFHLVAEFDVDATGRVLSVNFTETRDRGYNRRLNDVLRGFRFRAGTKPDGTPVRMKAQVVLDLY